MENILNVYFSPQYCMNEFSFFPVVYFPSHCALSFLLFSRRYLCFTGSQMEAREQKWGSNTGKSKSHEPQSTQWHPYMFSSSIPKNTIILASKMFTVLQWTTMPLRSLVFHSAVAMASMKRVVLDLNTKVNVIKLSEKKKKSVGEGNNNKV
jgi:hypothetical protein